MALVVTLAVVAGFGGQSATAADAAPSGSFGTIGLRLADVPVSATHDPRAQLYIVDHLAPGAVVERRIELANSTGAAAHVVLYPSAASVTDGAFVGADGHTPNDLSTWTSVGPAVFDLPAAGRAMATVTIAIPRDAAAGEQYAVVWAEVRRSASAGITQVNRVGIRLYVSVGPGGPPAANFTIDSLSARRSLGGRPTVVATVRNTGGRALDMSGTLQLSNGPGGTSAGPFPATLGVTLAIGDTGRVAIALDKQLPAGPWEAHIALRSGLLERTARATLSFPDDGSPVVGSSDSGTGWLYPAVAGSAILLLGITALSLRRRRR